MNDFNFRLDDKEEKDRTDLVCLDGEPAFRTLDYDCSGVFIGEVFTGLNGDVIVPGPDSEWTPGPCADTHIQCVETQEWTYGIDNTGTDYRWDAATYKVVLSDGSELFFEQTTASGGGWTPQMQEWGANIQTAADNAGLRWFVETRFRDPANPTSLVGGGGFPGPPSVPVSVALTNMLWRYVNIQICPGQPVPVSAEIVSHTGASSGSFPVDNQEAGVALTTDGAVLGPIRKLFVCQDCGDYPVWYLEDGVTEATAGQIPDCWEPCGTLSLIDAPPDRNCQFFFDLGCDDTGQSDPNNFVGQITRRATVCNGEQIGLEYYTEDPNDPTALVPYTLVGDFVDCDTGTPLELPTPPCDDFEYIGDVFTLENVTPGVTQTQYLMDNPRTDPVSLQDSLDEISQWTIGADGVPTPVDNGTLTVGPAAWPNLHVDEADNTTSLDSQILEGFIVTEEQLMFRYAGASEGYQAVWLDACCGTGSKSKIYERSINIGGPGTQGDAFGIIPAGIHAITVINLDLNGINSAATFQVSPDGGVTWAGRAPTLSTTKPVETCHAALKCIPSGLIIDALTGETLTDVSPCAIGCVTTATVASAAQDLPMAVCGEDLAQIGAVLPYLRPTDSGTVSALAISETGTVAPIVDSGLANGIFPKNFVGTNYTQNQPDSGNSVFTGWDFQMAEGCGVGVEVQVTVELTPITDSEGAVAQGGDFDGGFLVADESGTAITPTATTGTGGSFGTLSTFAWQPLGVLKTMTATVPVPDGDSVVSLILGLQDVTNSGNTSTLFDEAVIESVSFEVIAGDFSSCPEPEMALSTTGCNDDRRDQELADIKVLLSQILEALAGDDECPCVAPIATNRCMGYGYGVAGYLESTTDAQAIVNYNDHNDTAAGSVDITNINDAVVRYRGEVNVDGTAYPWSTTVAAVPGGPTPSTVYEYAVVAAMNAVVPVGSGVQFVHGSTNSNQGNPAIGVEYPDGVDAGYWSEQGYTDGAGGTVWSNVTNWLSSTLAGDTYGLPYTGVDPGVFTNTGDSPAGGCEIINGPSSDPLNPDPAV